MALLTLLAAVTIGVLRMRNLFGVVALAGIYGFLMASVLVVLDAVDVAMTEAAVGAGWLCRDSTKDHHPMRRALRLRPQWAEAATMTGGI